MQQCSITLYCPPMQIFKTVDRNVRMTAQEDMVCTITMPDGTKIIIPKVTIPPTPARRQGFLNWLVDACVGAGTDGVNSCVTNLPPEPTTFSLFGFTMIARQIAAPTTVKIGALTFSGLVTFPDTSVNIWDRPMITAVCNATGMLST